jgi:hypothetical protein
MESASFEMSELPVKTFIFGGSNPEEGGQILWVLNRSAR